MEGGVVERVQEQTQTILSQYITMQKTSPAAVVTQANYCGTSSSDALRFGHLLLLLAMIRDIRNSTVKELFFNSVTGPLPINALLTETYKCETFPLF